MARNSGKASYLLLVKVSFVISWFQSFIMNMFKCVLACCDGGVVRSSYLQKHHDTESEPGKYIVQLPSRNCYRTQKEKQLFDMALRVSHSKQDALKAISIIHRQVDKTLIILFTVSAVALS